ncbi:GNAT family N-acetyltransferase [Paenibacillus puldeungensis]|uniref:GNAT family N-acetyltransferase n=1 Tax=Paenibacillus puldeungensis TaxID=696536 RepID=A0ABW3S416_9BACL
MNEQRKVNILYGKQIYLRPAVPNDLDDYYTYLCDAEVGKFTGTQQTFTKEGTVRWLEKISTPDDSRVDLMIITKDTDQLVGEVVLNDIDPVNRSANIRIGITGGENRGKGYGSEALLLMLWHAFEKLHLHRVELGVFAFNKRAVHVYEKLGFNREGVQRDLLFLNQEYHDSILMSMLEHEYREKYMVESK